MVKQFVSPKEKRTKDYSATSDGESPAKKRKYSATPNVFHNRCSPKGLHGLVKKLSPRQKESVREIGFGSFLELGITCCPVRFCMDLLPLFNCQTRSIVLNNGVIIRLEEEDVECTLGIPRGKKTVAESFGVDEDDIPFSNLLRKWRRRWGMTNGAPNFSSMPPKILQNTAGDDDFKRDFVVYAVSSFLLNTQSSQARCKVLKSLQNVSKIKDYNWCKFTLDGVMEAIDSWQKNHKIYFYGSLTFIMVFYFDRIIVKGLNQNIRRRFPILGGWNDKLMRARIKYEKRHGLFAKGQVIERIAFHPVVVEEEGEDDVEEEGEDDDEEEEDEDEENEEEVENEEEDVHLRVNIVSVLKKLTNAFKDLKTTERHLRLLDIDPVPILVAGIQPITDLIKSNSSFRKAFRRSFAKNNINLNKEMFCNPSPPTATTPQPNQSPSANQAPSSDQALPSAGPLLDPEANLTTFQKIKNEPFCCFDHEEINADK